jgi:NAD(P)-dependent dehydrogenase (short-subunit alcohol dehydrogenase family)
VSGRLAGRVCAVTGASSGIGAAVAAALAAEGAAVVGFARRFEGAIVDGPPVPGQVASVKLDVCDETQVSARFAALAPLDLLVNAAGAGVFAPIERTDAAAVRAMLDVHVVGTLLCCRAALPALAGRGGHIIIIGSIAAHQPLSECAGYAAAKAGQHALARVLAEEARPSGVRVTTVTLGAVDTPIWDSRPGFDRAAMMSAAEVAALLVDVAARPSLSVDELVLTPPAGTL